MACLYGYEIIALIKKGLKRWIKEFVHFGALFVLG